MSLFSHLCLLVLSLSTVSSALAFTPTNYIPTLTTQTTQPQIRRRRLQSTLLHAKRRKNDKVEDTAWYDEVGKEATPDEVFWNEMDRQKANLEVPLVATTVDDPFSNIGSGAAMDYPPVENSSGPGVLGGGGGKGQGNGSGIMGTPLGEDKAATKTLANFAAFMVDDNWLNEEYAEMMGLEDVDIDQQDLDIDKHYAEMDINRGAGDEERIDISSLSIGGTNPWDLWNGDKVEEDDDLDKERIKIIMEKCKSTVSYNARRLGKLCIICSIISNLLFSLFFAYSCSCLAKSNMAKEFLLDSDVSGDFDADQYAAEEESKHLQKLAEIQLRSPSLDNAIDNPKAKAFFSRAPDEVEGFDRIWASAIDNACLNNLEGSFRNYGVEFACNFGEWENGCEDDAFQSIEDMASYKARKVYEVTGLPTIASQTSFEIEPIRVQDRSTPMNRGFQNTRTTSGYRFNDVGDHIDYVIEALKPYSDPSRVTRFRSCFCFYDGEMEFFDYGELDCDLHFSNSVRTYIPMSSGIDGMGKTLQLAFGLEFQGWLRRKVRDAMQGNESRVSIQLRDRILKEGKVLPNDIVDVSTFMDSMIDVNLMDDCAKELSNRFEKLKPTKILTVATTGLILAIPMAKYLQVPVVYARKERNVVMSDTYIAAFASKTVGKNRELLVSKKHISPDDRILIVDDFLSSGASQEALLRIVSDAGARAVGVGILLEKSYEAGRQFLSGFDIPVESVAKIASVTDGIITMEEEEGYVATD